VDVLDRRLVAGADHVGEQVDVPPSSLEEAHEAVAATLLGEEEVAAVARAEVAQAERGVVPLVDAAAAKDAGYASEVVGRQEEPRERRGRGRRSCEPRAP